MFKNLNLATKVFLLFFPLVVLTVAIILLLNQSFQQRSVLDHAKSVAESQAQTIRESIVEMMTVNEQVNDEYLDRIRDLGEIDKLELWSVHDRLHLRDQYVSEDRSARLRQRAVKEGSREWVLANRTFSSGEPIWMIRCTSGEHEERIINGDGGSGDESFDLCDSFNAVVPIVAEKKCQKCHSVPEGYVLSALHMNISMASSAEALQAVTERSVLVFILFTFASVVLGIVVFRRLVSTPLRSLVKGTEIIGSGNLNHSIRNGFANDELGRLASAFDRMQVKLREVQDQLIRKERLSVIGQTASAVAHDMRGPLTTIGLALDLLESDSGGNPDSIRQHERMRLTLEQMNRMIQDLLDFSRGEMRFSPEEIDADALIDRIIRDAAPGASDKGVSLKADLRYGKAAILDPHLLERAIVNLIQNGIDAAGEDGRVVVRTRSSSSVFLIEVSDTGPGIPAAVRQTIFEPFVTSGKEKGTGLGLSITRRIVEQHKGTIAFETGEGRGTTFRILLSQSPGDSLPVAQSKREQERLHF